MIDFHSFFSSKFKKSNCTSRNLVHTRSTYYIYTFKEFYLIVASHRLRNCFSGRGGGHKKTRFFAKNQPTLRKLLYHVNSMNDSSSKNAKVWLSKRIFFVKNHPNITDIFYQWRIHNRSTLFKKYFLNNFNLWKNLFFEFMSNFSTNRRSSYSIPSFFDPPLKKFHNRSDSTIYLSSLF